MATKKVYPFTTAEGINIKANYEWSKNEADRKYGRKEAVCSFV